MDHKPLLGIFDNREISNIPSPRISSLKENSLCYAFRTAYCLGKWHRGADAVSRNPTHNPSDSTISTRSNASDIDIAYVERISDQLHQKIASHIQALEQRDNNSHPDINNYTISTKLAQEYISDPTYQLLAIKIKNGFPNTQEQLDPKIRDYCDTRNHLTVIGNIILMDSQIVIPISMRKYVLSTLHVAHQGITSMCSWANESMYWTGLNRGIRLTRYNCKSCNKITPQQHQEPLIIISSLSWPFQKISADYFKKNSQNYLSVVDGFTAWLNIFQFSPDLVTSNWLISTLQALFIAFGIPEKVSTDRGPQFTSKALKTFLSKWGVKHRLSSAEYPQYNEEQSLQWKLQNASLWITYHLMALLVMIVQPLQSYNTIIPPPTLKPQFCSVNAPSHTLWPNSN